MEKRDGPSLYSLRSMQSKEWNMTNFAAPNMTAIGNINPSGTWDLGSNLTIQLGTSFTIEAWVRPNSNNPAGGTIFYSSDGFQFGLLNGALYALWPAKDSVKGEIVLSPSVWTYVALTFDGQRMSLYVDGGPDVSERAGGGFPNTQPDLMIGGNNPQGIDIWNLTLYNFARDVTAEANAPWQDVVPTPGIVASYDFSVAPPRELIQGLPITPGNGAQSQTIAPAIWFDKQGGGIYLTPPYSFATTPQYTVSAWVAPAGLTGSSGWQTVFFAGDMSGSNSDAVWLGFGNTTLAASQQFGAADAVANVSINPQEWHNVAMTCDGSTLIAYLDGQQVASAAAVPLQAGSNPTWHIGTTTNNANPFNGWVQWLSIWRRALTPDEMVLQMYAEVANDAGIVVDCPLDVSPAQDVTGTVQLQLDRVAFGEQRLNVSQWTPPPAQVHPPDLGNAARVTTPHVAPLQQSRGIAHPIAAFSDAHVSAAIAELEPYLAQLHPSVAPETRTRVEEQIRAAFKTAREHPESIRQITSYHREGDEWVFVLHHETKGDVELMRIAFAALTRCQMWWLSFCFTLLSGVASILFLKINDEALTDWVARRLLNNPAVMAALTNLIQNQALTATTLIGILRILYQNGLLKSLLWTIASGASWWAVGKAFTYIAGSLIFGNAAAVAAWAVQSAVLVAKLGLQMTSYSSSCN